MKFPPMVDDPKLSTTERAVQRLRYMVAMLAFQHTGRRSMRALAEKVDLDHSTLSTYIRRGSFSVSAAAQISDKLGEGAVNPKHLVNPMSAGKTRSG